MSSLLFTQLLEHQSDTLPLVIEIPDIKAETFKGIFFSLETSKTNNPPSYFGIPLYW